MPKRNRYGDTSSLGKSNLIPYRKNEDPKSRHYRRLKVNLNWRNDLIQWARANSFRVEVKNEGHHWILVKPEIRVEWWPSSAKLVINQKWDKGIHCHDYKQLIDLLQKNNIPSKEEKQA